MDGLDLAGVRAVIDEVMLGLLGDEPCVGQFLPRVAVEGGLNSNLNLALKDAATDRVRARRVRQGQGGGLATGVVTVISRTSGTTPIRPPWTA